MSRDHEILGVPEGATIEEIRQAYKRRARELHPDKCQGCDSVQISETTEKFQILLQAYERLSNKNETQDDLETKTTDFTFDGISLLVCLGCIGLAAAAIGVYSATRANKAERKNRKMNWTNEIHPVKKDRRNRCSLTSLWRGWTCYWINVLYKVNKKWNVCMRR